MKNNFKIIFIITLFIFFNSKIFAKEKFYYEANEIEILEKGNIIKATDNIKITLNNNVKITADKFLYNKKAGLLELIKNIEIIDKKNDLIIEANKIYFSVNENRLYSNSETYFYFSKKYSGEAKSFNYSLDNKEIISQDEIKIYDHQGNIFFIKEFKYQIPIKTFRGSETKFIDLEKNEYLISDTMINLENYQIFGKDLTVLFEKSSFGNIQNDPRLKARSFNSKNGLTSINKGVFTTCKKTEKCPAWSISADNMTHNKKKKTIEYKNAWLQVYDVPVVYFPKFSHPDPTVKRQSGFLTPSTTNSNNLGLSFDIPYYYVISDNKDLTFTPRFYFDDQTILQNEYRQKNKNSSHVIDFSINSSNYFGGENETKAHLFSNSQFNIELDEFDYSNLEVNIEKTSNDTYLKTYKIDSPIIKNNSLLNSYLTLNTEREYLSFKASLEMYEDLSKNKSDRYEFIYPNYKLTKDIDLKGKDYNQLRFLSYGYQKNYETNIYEGTIINDLFFNSSSKISEKGLKSNFSGIIKNVNLNAKNSNRYKNKFDQSLLTSLLFTSEYPLKKAGDTHESNLTPKLSLMYSPNKTKNMTNEDRRIETSNIFSFNRIASNDTVEGGSSLTIGAEYKKIDKNNFNELVNLNLATVVRPQENEDLPLRSSIGKKTSDLFGNIKIKPSKNFSLNYDFAIDNNLDKSNYDSFKTKFSVNNFVTTFEYLDDKNQINEKSYISNETNYSLNESNSLGFNIRKNKKTNATEFYDLFYSYSNDCLIASVKFNKEYYTDSDLKPGKQILLSLTLIPFGTASTPNISN
jgi:LPS-assembly protein